MPKVSVIIPVYNVENYLEECLNSIINQTLKDIEIICVDDGSTDSSLNILKQYKQKDNRITILKNKGVGAGGARNTGLEYANGEYISFLDSDDFFELDMLEKMYKNAISNDADFVVCGFNIYNTLKKNYYTWEKECSIPAEIKKFKTFSPNDINNIFLDVSPNIWTKLYNLNFIKQNNIKFQEIKTCNDLYFSCISKMLANKISYIDKPFVHYRQGLKTNIRSRVHKYPLEFAKALTKIKDFAEEKNIYKNFKRQLNEFFIFHIKNNGKKLKKHKLAYIKFRLYISFFLKNRLNILYGGI